jgi:hypothetical protein
LRLEAAIVRTDQDSPHILTMSIDSSSAAVKVSASGAAQLLVVIVLESRRWPSSLNSSEELCDSDDTNCRNDSNIAVKRIKAREFDKRMLSE